MYIGFKHDPDWLPYAPETPGDASTSSDLAVRQFRLPVAAPALAGKRLLFFSDLHWANQGREHRERLITQINAIAADWIAFGGDLIRFLEFATAAFGILRELRAGLAKLAVLGNRERIHEWFGMDRWHALYREAGFELLVNETWLDPACTAITFTGIDDPRWGHPDLRCAESAPADRFRVLLTHSPDAVGHTTGQRLGDLVLAGHTHGGQIRLPLVGALYTSSGYWRQFDRGWRRRQSDGTQLYVTTGVGETRYPMLERRILCPAEFAVFEFVQGAGEAVGCRL
ncbi:MAG: hypothetical protein A3K19_27000 [Lentisphaerae bacterium RIFOXYB12_FULL_65_16]|nr:MAG: hypothetical protein A3K18_28185 [Lentisphaerae bacterium RIFOXYA12_64_32]OGV88051.1 MAG: hypothetical protein A3K19_27000 [Lentisphaerae bacterium RIFOXYB12_FULL_65_16]